MAVEGRTKWQKEGKGQKEEKGRKKLLLCVTEQVKEKLQTTTDDKIRRLSRKKQ